MEEKKTDSVGAKKFISPIRPPAYAKATAAKPAGPESANNDISISTMQDDIAVLNASPKEAKRSPDASATKTFPLPPKNVTKQQKVIVSPLPPSSRSRF